MKSMKLISPMRCAAAETPSPAATMRARIKRLVQVALSTAAAVFASTVVAQAPTVQLYSGPDAHLQFGNSTDAYWMEDNSWGANGVTEGPGAAQFEQQVGVHPSVGPNGEVAFRMKWRWPLGVNEVKGYPAVLSGRKPGLYSSTNQPGGQPVRLLDGSYSQTAPSGPTPNTFMSMQLPISNLVAKFNRSHVAPPTGQGQLTFDIWLQSHSGQDAGFTGSSITHEIMIPLENWGNYGAHPNNRNSFWYDHDVTIDGRLFHVYATKTWDPNGPNHEALLYNFGELNGTYGRTGWKMIAFVPSTPITSGEINVAAIVNHVATRTDVKGNRWAQGNEYLVSAELGVEPIEGTGDIVVYDYKFSSTASLPPTQRRIQAENGTLTGVTVKTNYAGYEGTGFVGSFVAEGDKVAMSFSNVAAGTYDIRIRYLSPNNQQNFVSVNGTSRSEAFPSTGSAWGIKTVSGVSLTGGTNTIAILKEWGWIDVDYVEIVPKGGASRVQAENGVLTGVTVKTNYPGYEGTGFVGSFVAEGDKVAVSFGNVTAGTYDIRIRYLSPNNQQNFVSVNGTSRSEAFPSTGSAWGIKTVSGVSLTGGTNTIAILKEWGWMDVDYVEIAPAGN